MDTIGLCKRKTLSFTILFIVLCSLSSCLNSQSKDNRIDYYRIANSAKTISTILDAGIGDNISFVALETKDDCLVGYIDDIQISDDYIFILSEDRLLLFNKDGKFVRSIGSRGLGPDDLLQLRSFDVDSSLKEVYISGLSEHKVLVFDYYGDVKRKIDIPEGFVNHIEINGDRLLISYLTILGNEEKSFVEVDKSGMELFSMRNPMHFELESPIMIADGRSLKSVGSKVLYRQSFNDTIYVGEIGETGLHPSVIVDFSGREMPKDVLGRPDLFESKKAESAYILDYQEYGPYLFLTILDREEKVHLLIDEGKDMLYVVENAGVTLWPVATEKDCLLGVIQSSKLKDAGTFVHDESLDSMIQTAGYDDNPILWIVPSSH